ncbi:transducin family protein [Eremomyces bilateralis CBS 781.70]|uniref:Transducin family protein n=1 Tax=Eremomyces bilateralis CBS 781.70 TaxID=1392243 RepID=A0A6G1FZE9_9PEZI|nr:transducin family protein [Eremomyces bilateralis CBS 781.70]KAF1811173.1 transducin family protein [Eremomyces bilateralis CBS 781.70]
MSMITAATWVPRGRAAQFPQKFEISEEEYDRIGELADLRLQDARDDLEEAKAGDANEEEAEEEVENQEPTGDAGTSTKASEGDDDLKEYNLEHYDDEPDGAGDTMAMFGNVKTLAFHESNEEDPYITIKDEDDHDDEREELQILPSDNLLLAARIEDDMAHLEVYIYEDEADNLYVHHDLMLPDIPLAVEWINYRPGGQTENPNAGRSFVAVSTMGPDIELWDLDVVDAMLPDVVLGKGKEDETTKPSKKKKKRPKLSNDEYHVDAVLSLASNRSHPNLLASASADQTIKLWDLNTNTCAKSYSYHTDKVCSVAWHPKEPTVLLSGSYDRTVVAADMRAPEAKAPRWKVESDVENVRWDPHSDSHFYVTTENGLVHYHDIRSAPTETTSLSPSVWSLQAHDSSVSSFDINPIIPGFLATGSTDKQVKLWNVTSAGPSMVVSRDLGVGRVFVTSFAPDQEVGFRLAVAGSKGSVQVWDTSTNAAVRRNFAGRVAGMGDGSEEVKERMVGRNDVDEEDSDDERDDPNGGSDGYEDMSE